MRTDAGFWVVFFDTCWENACVLCCDQRQNVTKFTGEHMNAAVVNSQVKIVRVKRVKLPGWIAKSSQLFQSCKE